MYDRLAHPLPPTGAPHPESYPRRIWSWLSRDPIGEWGGLNLFSFVANNPILYSDQNGLCSRIPRACRGYTSSILCGLRIDEKKLAPRTGDSGSTCKGGQIEIYTAPEWDQEGCNLDCIKPCVIVHENVHKTHLDAYPYSEVCEGREGKSPHFPPLDPDRWRESEKKNVASEIIALTAELGCLGGKKGAKDCLCCQDEIDARITTQEGKLQEARDAWDLWEPGPGI